MPFGSVRSVSSIYSSSKSTGRCSCCRYPWSASAAVVWLLIILSQLLPTSGSALCSRCETPELAALHRYYDTLGTTGRLKTNSNNSKTNSRSNGNNSNTSSGSNRNNNKTSSKSNTVMLISEDYQQE